MSLNTTQAPRRSARLAKNESKSVPESSPTGISPEKPRKKPKIKKKAPPPASDEEEIDTELTSKPSKPLYKLSSMNFPNTDAPSFGLAQEKLADEPLKVLLACVFLTLTKGSVSMPVCREMFKRYPTVEALVKAEIADLTKMIQPLGLHNTRARTIIKLATAWQDQPPAQGKRYRKLHYPSRGDGADIPPSKQPIGDESLDHRVAWEIAHIPGVGAYALDSWRIFCRDKLRGIEDGLLDVSLADNMARERLQEWTRVVPLDKELIAYIRWRWLRLGYLWNPVDGSKLKVDPGIIAKMQNREVESYKGFDNPWVVYAIQGKKP